MATHRQIPIDLSPEAFRRLGHDLVDQIAGFLESLPNRPVTRGLTPKDVQRLLGEGGLPERGTDPAALLAEIAPILFDNSLHNGHPRFLGYITSSAAPLGALGELLAASVNSNVGAWDLAPVATEIERQTIRWIAEFIGYPSDTGGIMVSGGNMANLIGFYAARSAKAPWAIREQGLYASERPLTVYTSAATHTWIQKAADLAGLGTNNIRWIATDGHQRMRVDALEAQVIADLDGNCMPFLVAATAGTVSTGSVDPLPAIAALCKKYGLWFHVDGAYGAPAASLPDASDDLQGLRLADSVALDPHKWLYSPLEAGCALVRNPEHLTGAFSFRPEYYHFENDEADPRINYYEYGIQNSRGFRALKVWLTLRSIGRAGYIELLQQNMALARRLFDAVAAHPELEAQTLQLSITTFRYRPADLGDAGDKTEAYLNELNEALLSRLQSGGEAYVSNAVLDGRMLLRACIVNFRTAVSDIDALPEIVVRHGRALDRELRASCRETRES